MAADLNGFNDMDNDAVCHMAADVAVTWTTIMTWTMTWHDDVEFLGPLCERPYSSSGPHFSPEFHPLEIISAHEKYPSHLTHRIINTKIFHTEFSPDTIKFSP
jgi:hypothetical protein